MASVNPHDPLVHSGQDDGYDPSVASQWNPEHQDLVSAISYNDDGQRMATSSADHRIKVWDIDRTESKFKLLDTFKAHDGEILETQWLASIVAQALGSVGTDFKLKIWVEDVSSQPNSGRRFSCVFSYSNPSLVPFASLSFKTSLYIETTLAILSSDGRMRIFTTANEPDALTDWTEHSTFSVCEPPARGDETAFKVSFHPDSCPHWNLMGAGLASTAISMVVAAMGTSKVYRTNADGRFYLAAELPGHKGIVRDVAWRPEAMLGCDFVATTAKDSRVRLFRVSVKNAPDLVTSVLRHQEAQLAVNAGHEGPASGITARPSSAAGDIGSQHQPSGIGAGLQGGMTAMDQAGLGVGLVEEVAQCVQELPASIGMQWRIKWSSSRAKQLFTAGDDGEVRVWAPAATKDSETTYELFGVINEE
ncbi:MAG: epoxide hydrolase, soluble (sEH) [Vezdaea aestivalis]|nr:MAG: epoxide hydrolase, soluble (sEH) [Vezdaea aestivalis]